MRIHILAITTAVVACLLPAAEVASAAPSAPARPAAEEPAIPTLKWAKCNVGGEEFKTRAAARAPLCATAKVPLDYDDPTGPTTTLDLLKVPAGNPAQKIGTLFVNPGGPSGSSTSFASFFPELVRPVVSGRFDIVGIDPRGVGRSAPMVCRNPARPPNGFFGMFPMTKSQAAAKIAADRWLRTACRTKPSPIVNHMSTADTARDMDLIRQAVGDEKLTYYGVSYGSYLGATYAAMFPTKVRALIVDGVLDPISWSKGRGDAAKTQPFSTRLRSGYGAHEALMSAFARCDVVGKRRCALSGNAKAKWNRIAEKLKHGPVQVDDFKITYADLYGNVLGGLYDARQYQPMMRWVRDLHTQMFGPKADRDRLGRAALAWKPTQRPHLPEPGKYGVASDAFSGVACADSVNPTDPWQWWHAGISADKKAPGFGRLWTWVSSTCASWPGVTKADAFMGPWGHNTSYPMLVVGNSHDPATPLHGAKTLRGLFGNSRLVQLDDWGHGALGGNDCIDAIYRDYLVSQKLPRDGRTCARQRSLFP